MNVRGGTRYGNQVHPRSCACPRCDPEQTKLAAARARANAEKAVSSMPAAPVVLAKSPGARPMRFRPPATPETHRLRELLREGKTFAQAQEIIEAEKNQRKDPGP